MTTNAERDVAVAMRGSPDWYNNDGSDDVVADVDAEINFNALARIAIAALTASKEPLLNLLAVIHRDGGHYTGDHGLEASVAEAMRLSSERIADLGVSQEPLRRALEKIRDFKPNEKFEPDPYVQFAVHAQQTALTALADPDCGIVVTEDGEQIV